MNGPSHTTHPLCFLAELLCLAHLSQDMSQCREASLSIDALPLDGWYTLFNLVGSLDVIFSTVLAHAPCKPGSQVRRWWCFCFASFWANRYQHAYEELD